MSDGSPLPPDPSSDPRPTTRFTPAWRTRNRRSSVTLRRDGAAEELGSLMDPATQSLSDALRITYRFLLIGVLALVAFYLFSGFRRVSEGERGMRLLFGRVVSDDVGPGFRFSWPEPFGELVKVKTGVEPISIDDDFFPQLNAEEKKTLKDKGQQALAGTGYPKLNPETDGSLITGDGNLAHTRWSITYHRDDPKRVEEHIDPEFEKSIVLAACKRGIIRAAASVSIDELLTNNPDKTRTGEWRSVENVARTIAQRTLDSMNSGLRIDLFSLTVKIPPRRNMPDFARVQSSQAEAAKSIEDAGAARKGILTAAAGNNAELILAQINRYAKALELKDEAAANQVLERIDRLLAGEPVEIDGKPVTQETFGTVKTILSQAESEKRTYLSNLSGEVQRFNSKLDTYRKNPMVLVNTEWADAYASVLARQNLESIFLPQLSSDSRFVISINPNPEVVKEIQAAISKRKAEAANAERIRLQLQQRFREKLEPTIKRGTD